jgi:CYTH domain-containing protein
VATSKYAHVERERRWLLAAVPDLPEHARRLDIVDRYVSGTRLRLREVTEAGLVTRKLGQKVRLGQGAGEVAHTSIYLDQAEWDRLATLPAAEVRKARTLVSHVEGMVAVDVFGGHLAGLVLAEVDAGEGQPWDLSASYGILGEVTGDEAFTGGALALAR